MKKLTSLLLSASLVLSLTSVASAAPVARGDAAEPAVSTTSAPAQTTSVARSQGRIVRYFEGANEHTRGFLLDSGITVLTGGRAIRGMELTYPPGTFVRVEGSGSASDARIIRRPTVYSESGAVIAEPVAAEGAKQDADVARGAHQ